MKRGCYESNHLGNALELVGVVEMIPFASHIIAAAVAGAVAFGAAWTYQGNRYTAKIAAMQAQQAQQLAQARKDALDNFTRMQEQKDAAIQQAENRTKQNAAAAAAARRAADGLREQLAGVPGRIAAATDSAVREYASTASAVLGECIAEYQALGTAADGHANDARLMREAWPTAQSGPSR